ncbi:MAG: hypothetical protein JXD22_03350 [Sedimentisphaerales bacterium]|nr:hypothetical protein [Sedimentisphaerales bacterium]
MKMLLAILLVLGLTGFANAGMSFDLVPTPPATTGSHGFDPADPLTSSEWVELDVVYSGDVPLWTSGDLTLTITGPGEWCGADAASYEPAGLPIEQSWTVIDKFTPEYLFMGTISMPGFNSMVKVDSRNIVIGGTTDLNPGLGITAGDTLFDHLNIHCTGPGEVTVTLTPATSSTGTIGIPTYWDGDLFAEDLQAVGSELTIYQDPGSSVTGDITISKLTINAGKSRETPSDKITILGTLTDAPESFDGTENLSVQIRSGTESFNGLDVSIPINTDPGVKLSASKGITKKLKYLNSSAPSVVISIDLAKGKFAYTAQNADLTGLKDTVSVTLSLDDFTVSEEVDEDIINGTRKLIPLSLLSGHTDALRVSSAKVGKKADTLAVKGEIAAASSIDLRTEQVTITWGGQNFVIPENNFQKKKETAEKYTLKKLTLGDDTVADANIDLDKGSFSIKFKSTTIQAVSGTVNFGISLTGFSASYDWTFPTP